MMARALHYLHYSHHQGIFFVRQGSIDNDGFYIRGKATLHYAFPVRSTVWHFT